jgi:hypothetical protein
MKRQRHRFCGAPTLTIMSLGLTALTLKLNRIMTLSKKALEITKKYSAKCHDILNAQSH